MQKRTERIKFWLDDKILSKLERQAKKANMNRSEYVRYLIANCQVIHAPEIDYDKYQAEFKALGDELDRYLIAINSADVFSEKKLESVCNRILELMKTLEREISEKLKNELQKAKGGSKCETESAMLLCD